MTLPQIKILRRSQVLTNTGLSKSTLYLRINQQLFCPPIQLGVRAVGFIEHEVNAVLTAMVAGKSNKDIQALVKTLVSQRKIAA